MFFKYHVYRENTAGGVCVPFSEKCDKRTEQTFYMLIICVERSECICKPAAISDKNLTCPPVPERSFR